VDDDERLAHGERPPRCSSRGARRDAKDEIDVAGRQTDRPDEIESALDLMHEPVLMVMPRGEERTGTIDRRGESQRNIGQIAEICRWQRTLTEGREDHRCIERLGANGV